MRQFWVTICFFALLQQAQAQQWVDKQYSYDSIYNISYGTAVNFNGGTETLQLDLYMPVCTDSSARRPLLLLAHGGAFLEGNKNDQSIHYLCRQFAKRGYVTASIGYRLGMIGDEAAWNCNYPNYNCVFATDSAEWYRAYYRAVQDGKGALRYLINRHAQYRIDTANVFVGGESAGAFLAMGLALLDTLPERPVQTYAISAANKPSANTNNCSYNAGEVFAPTIPRPDLGDLEGNIEPTPIKYTIKGVANIYGAMLTDLLRLIPQDKPKPAIYSFHQPCDIVVPIDSNQVMWGLSWCFTNGYNCYGISNTPKIYGSRVIRNWNTANNYGYNIRSEFTSVNFPYSFVLGQGSCLDQVNNPCHAYDNRNLRELQIAQFFAPLVSTSKLCGVSSTVSTEDATLRVSPNPFSNTITVYHKNGLKGKVEISDLQGRRIHIIQITDNQFIEIDLKTQPQGIYLLNYTAEDGKRFCRKLVKQ